MGTFTIAERNNVLALVVFVVVAAAVSAVVERAARRTREAARAAAEASMLATLAGSVLQGANPLAALLEQLQETFGLATVSLLERPTGQLDDGGWEVVASVGQASPSTPGEADLQVPASDTVTLAATGPAPRPEDLRVLSAFAARRPRPWNGSASPSRPNRRRARSRPTACAPPCSPPSATTCAARSPRPRPRSAASAAAMSPGPRGIATSCWPPRTSPWTG